MAIINKTGITNGSTIEAEHITRAIDALSGVSTDTIVATGSFSGSLKGDANLNTLNVDTIYFPNSPIYTVAGTGNSIILNYEDDETNTVINHFSGDASTQFLETSLTTTVPVIAPGARISGSLNLTGSLDIKGPLNGNITGSSTLIMNLSTLGSSGNFILPTSAPSAPINGSIYWDDGDTQGRLYIYSSINDAWLNVSVGS